MSRSSSKYYCDYCDCYLVSQSIAVRKQHNNGAKHKANVKAYYLQFLQEATQKSIDKTVRLDQTHRIGGRWTECEKENMLCSR